jgi:soluble lytic murein transglycosylase
MIDTRPRRALALHSIVMWRPLVLVAMLAATGPLAAQAPAGDALIVEAHAAQRKKDRPGATALVRLKAQTQGHPLAMWVDYWELGGRLAQAQQPELDAFYQRWAGTYVEDRLRNDWLLELGRRRDFANFRRDMPAFRMNDDREVSCYHLLTQHQDGQDVREAARALWFAQRELDDGCQLLARTLYEAKVFKADDAWREARLSIENNRPRAAVAAAALVSAQAAASVGEAAERPAQLLKRLEREGSTGTRGEVALLALMRAAANDTEWTAAQLTDGWASRLGPSLSAWAWAAVARQAALKLEPEAAQHAARAFKALGRAEPGWSDDTLGWIVRALLRANPKTMKDAERWSLIRRAIDAMTEAERREGSGAAWAYWRARAVQALAAPAEAGAGERAEAQAALEALASPLHFYGQLALEELGRKLVLPQLGTPPGEAERGAVRNHPGLARALQLIALGLRHEGVREWNWSLRGMDERTLLAAAQWACEREVWDRCINTSERSRQLVDVAQRYPTPLREAVLAKAQQVGVDAAYVYGLIRQESRFIMDARSHVGASGLMQLMPATARWTAKRVGLAYKPEMITDRDTNLLLGTTYLKLVLDDFAGQQAMAAAAYNAGPGRPRRWRDPAQLAAAIEPAAWAETIPFNETRDYVKKVLANAAAYAAVLGQGESSLKARLGPLVTPGALAARGAEPLPSQGASN